jgi:hypothetical protein
VTERHGPEVDPARLPVLYFSPTTNALRDWVDHTDIVIEALGLVDRTAQTGTAPIRILAGSLHDRRR